jgi:integrase
MVAPQVARPVSPNKAARPEGVPAKVVLTDRAIKAWPAASNGRRYLVWDAAQPCLAIRITSTGAKSFVVIRRRPGDRDPLTAVLGSYPAVTLKDAREEASKALKLIVGGKSPGEARAEERRQQARKKADTFGAAVEVFLDGLQNEGLRSFRDVEGPLRREFLGQTCKVEVVAGKRVARWEDRRDPVWRDRPIVGIKRADVVERLDVVKRRGGKHAARHALSAVRKFFNWCADGERFGVQTAPTAGVKDGTFAIRGKDLKRTRVLNDSELRDVWQAAGELGYPFGSVVQLLMISGQRVGDISETRWSSEIDLNAATLVVPPERYKTNTAQEVPLPPLAVEILRAVPRFTGPFVFTTTAGVRPINMGSKAKGYIDAAIAQRRRERGDEPMPDWVFHDLRRTVRTRLVSDLGVDAFIAERVIGHTLPGLHGVYDQGTHRTQKRAALEAWAKALTLIVEPPPAAPGKVVSIGREGRR